MKMSKFLISNEPMSIIECYEAIARQMGYAHTKKLHYNCTKVNVAQNIQDGFYEFYTKKETRSNPNVNTRELQVQITMLLAMSGPKVDAELKANEVEVFDGFICD